MMDFGIIRGRKNKHSRSYGCFYVEDRISKDTF